MCCQRERGGERGGCLAYILIRITREGQGRERGGCLAYILIRITREGQGRERGTSLVGQEAACWGM